MRVCRFCSYSSQSGHETGCVWKKGGQSEERIHWNTWYTIGLSDNKNQNSPLKKDPVALLGYNKGQEERIRSIKKGKPKSRILEPQPTQ